MLTLPKIFHKPSPDMHPLLLALIVCFSSALALEAKPLKLSATSFETEGTGYYLDRGKWLAIDPAKNKTAKAVTASRFPSGKYHITLEAIGEKDGSSTYFITINGSKIGEHTSPLSKNAIEEGKKYHAVFKNIELQAGDVIEVSSTIASADGKEFSRARWAGLTFSPANAKTVKAVAKQDSQPTPQKPSGPPLQQPRKPDGNATVTITGEPKQWHKLTLTLDGPYAHELDNAPNPFTAHSMWVTFIHESRQHQYTVPAYFAADGNASETSAEAGTKWRAHFSPDHTGEWEYRISFRSGEDAAFTPNGGEPIAPFDGKTGNFTITPSDKTAPDFRSRGRLAYVGKHHLQFLGDQSYFLKAGADAPETLLAYADFDNTSARKPGVPIKTWAPHLPDWQNGDPTWKGNKGKALIGALNYLSTKGMNAFSFLPYNVGGDGDNVWPFTHAEEKFHYDCSKLDQWGIIFDHATAKGLFLHFKLQETEIDDNRPGQDGKGPPVPSSLDGGKLGPERKLYCREIIARFGHALALNWNLGEENTQSTSEIKDMAEYVRSTDPYKHPIVLHTYPNQQDKQYKPLLGDNALDGLSLQNSNIKACHHQVVKWTQMSSKAGKPWVVSFDEPGDAVFGMPPDDSYANMAELRKSAETRKAPTIHDVRKYTLWGTIMAGGGGVEYYFGYKLPENDLLAEDWRSRDQSWDYARHALEFFRDQKIPFQEMTSRNELIGNPKNDNSKYCFAKDGGPYLLYLPEGGSTDIKLPSGKFTAAWFNPRTGELGKASPLSGNSLTAPDTEDWLALIRPTQP